MSLGTREDTIESTATSQAASISTLNTNTALLLRGASRQWATGTAYQINDVVWSSGYPIICLTAHTSNVYATDVTSGYWQMVGSWKNNIINGNFDVWQRGATFNPSNIYTADRWFGNNASVSVTQGAGSAATNSTYLFVAQGSAVSNAFNAMYSLEQQDVRPLQGKIITCSMFMSIVSGTQSIGFSISKNATPNTQTGGTWNVISTTTCNLTTIRQKFSVTVLVPNDGTAEGLRIQLSQNNVANGVNIVFANAMLNEGPAPAIFQTAGVNAQAELAMCQRYYERMGDKATNSIQVLGYGAAATNVGNYIPFRVTKRISPTMNVAGTWVVTNCAQPGTTGVSQDGFVLFATVTTLNAFNFINTANTTAYVEATAEL